MDSPDGLDAIAAEVQDDLRRFDYSGRLEMNVKRLQQRLEQVSNPSVGAVDLDRPSQLKALSLVAEYWEIRGKPDISEQLLKKTAHRLLTDYKEWKGEIDNESRERRELYRERVWCLLGYSLALSRKNELSDAEGILHKMREFVEGSLVKDQDFPCHGTLSKLNYILGLIYRNQGRLDQASRHLSIAMEEAVARRDQKIASSCSPESPEEKREILFAKGTIARITAFGFGAIEFYKANYLISSAWYKTGHEILASTGQGELKALIQLYLTGIKIMMSKLSNEFIEPLRDNIKRLNYIALQMQQFEPANSMTAEAFGLLAEIRILQIDGSTPNALSMTIGRNLSLQRRASRLSANVLEEMPAAAYTTATLTTVETLLRSELFDEANSFLKKAQDLYGQRNWFLDIQLKLLQAEYYLLTSRLEECEQSLNQFLNGEDKLNPSQTARAWALLSVCHTKRHDSSGANAARKHALMQIDNVTDGYTLALSRYAATITGHANQSYYEMPYEGGVENPNRFNAKENMKVCAINTLRAAIQQNPECSVDKLATIIGVSRSWIYNTMKESKEDWTPRIKRSKGVQLGGIQKE